MADLYQPVMGGEEDEEEDVGIHIKSSWKRKGDRVNFFTVDAANADFFDLLKAPASSLKDKTVLDGWLKKLGGKGIKQNWRRRWFVLTYDKYLYYYKTELDDLPSGVVCLEDYGGCAPQEDKSKKKFHFYLHNNDQSTVRIYKFFTETQKECLQWVSAIEQVIKTPKLDNTRTKIVQRKPDSEDAVRTCARLYVRVAEARNLPKAMTGSSASCYCIIDLADKQVRTQTIWSTREPMWMEEFYLDVVNPEEETAKITCWRMEKAGKGDVIGKIEVPVQSLCDQKQHEQWYPLTSADAKQYMSGEVHLKVQYKPEENILIVQVVSAKNLAPKGIGGTSDTYIRLQIGKRKKKTKTVNRTLHPTFNDIFEFKLKNDDENELVLVLWHKDRLNSIFMGQIIIAFSTLDPNFLYDGWYVVNDHNTGDHVEEEVNEEAMAPESSPGSPLGSHRTIGALLGSANRRFTLLGDTPIWSSDSQIVTRQNRAATEEKSKRVHSDLGDVRLVLKYTEEIVLPDQEYTELLDLLMEDQLDIIRALGEVTNEKEDVGRCLAQIFEVKGKGEELIITLTCDEVETTPDASVLFRANSLATKAFDYYLKLIALPYLHETLEDVIKEVYSTKKPCEVDPTRVEKMEEIPKHFSNLTCFAEEICSAIFSSIDLCPHKIRRICSSLQDKVLECYPTEENADVKYTSVSGFLFLRFFCPSILGPKLFELMKDHPDMKTARTLTLLAKTLQNLSNLCEFEYKEAYMQEMNGFIQEKTPLFKSFMDSLCTVPDAPRREDCPPINFGREMATIHRHLANNFDAILNTSFQSSSSVKKLDGVLQRLVLVKEAYELFM